MTITKYIGLNHSINISFHVKTAQNKIFRYMQFKSVAIVARLS